MDLVEAKKFHARRLTHLGRSPATLTSYALYEQKFLDFLEEHDLDPALETLNPQFVLEFTGWLKSGSRGRRGGACTARQAAITLGIWARFLWRENVYEADPLARLVKPKVMHIQRKPFGQEDAKRLLQAASVGPNPIRDRALMLVLADTGCRIGELCAAQVADVDMAEGSITFTHTKGGRPRKVIFRVQSRRDGGPTLQALRMWLKVREARPGIDTLFTTRERLGLSVRRARQIHEELGRAARVPNCHPHRWRHTAATGFLAERPGAEIQLRSRLGQVSRDVLRDYVTISDPTAFEAAEVASLSSRWGL